MITEQEINKAKKELSEALVLYHNVSADLANFKSSLEIAKAQGLANGSIEGKNAELREASARQVLTTLYDEVDEGQMRYDDGRLRLDLARVEDDRCKMLLRLAELTGFE